MSASPRGPHQPEPSDPGQGATDHPWARADDTPDRTPSSPGSPSEAGADQAAEGESSGEAPAHSPTGSVRIVQGHPTGFEPGINKGGQNGSPKPDGRSARRT